MNKLFQVLFPFIEILQIGFFELVRVFASAIGLQNREVVCASDEPVVHDVAPADEGFRLAGRAGVIDVDFADVALREDTVEVADGTAENGGSIFPGEEPIEVELDSLMVGNQKDVDVLLKEQKPTENVLEEGLVVFLNMFRSSHSTGKHKHYVRNIQERMQDIGLQVFENRIVRQCNSTADVCRIVPVERMCRMLQIFQIDLN